MVWVVGDGEPSPFLQQVAATQRDKARHFDACRSGECAHLAHAGCWKQGRFCALTVTCAVPPPCYPDHRSHPSGSTYMPHPTQPPPHLLPPGAPCHWHQGGW
jgi:hypothetical protein